VAMIPFLVVGDAVQLFRLARRKWQQGEAQ
jgi:hypothetical protein